MDDLASRVKFEREAKDWSQERLAEEVTRLGFKIGQIAIGNIESGSSKQPKCIVQLAAALTVTAQWLQTGKGNKAPNTQLILDGSSPSRNREGDGQELQSEVKDTMESFTLPNRHEMKRDVPVLGTSVGGTGSDFSMNGDTIDFVRRPPRLEGRADVFSLYVVGDSMWPWRKPRSIIYCEAKRAPSIGDYVVIELRAPIGSPDKPALLKELIGLTASRLKLRQYNPPREFEIERKRVEKMYRVIDTDELFSI